MGVVMMGGGRSRGDETIDHRVGFAGLPALGTKVEAGATLAMIHGADEATADNAATVLTRAIAIADAPEAPPELIRERVAG
jgi:thymidine phosphorylase